MKILPLQGSTVKTVFSKKISTAFGGRPDGGITSFCLVWSRSARPTWQNSLNLHEGVDIQQVS
jgi:hypothetical protein